MTEAEHRPSGAHYGEDGKPKRPYATKAIAKAAARRFLADYNSPQYPYRCQDETVDCGLWHLSKWPRRKDVS